MYICLNIVLILTFRAQLDGGVMAQSTKLSKNIDARLYCISPLGQLAIVTAPEVIVLTTCHQTTFYPDMKKELTLCWIPRASPQRHQQ